jgi:hypothetical protein
MNGCLLIRTLLLGMALMPLITKGQNEYARPASYKVEGNSITSNVPLNEISIRAFRYFHRHFPEAAGESWVKSADGYIVSFIANSLRRQAHFDRRGGFLYCVKYYAGKDVARELFLTIKEKYQAYDIDVVTEITDDEKTFYLVKIKNNSSIKTLSVCDGKIAILEELVNGEYISAVPNQVGQP